MELTRYVRLTTLLVRNQTRVVLKLEFLNELSHLAPIYFLRNEDAQAFRVRLAALVRTELNKLVKAS